MADNADDDLVEYDEEEVVADVAGASKAKEGTKKGHYVGIHASGFKDFLLKPELLRAIVDAGFEHPSEVQHESIPQAVLGGDIICQAKSGMGKTAGTIPSAAAHHIFMFYGLTPVGYWIFFVAHRFGFFYDLGILRFFFKI